MTNTYGLRVRTFRMGTEHDVVAKILEEASEAHMAWRVYRDSAEDMSHVVDELMLLDLADELADCITACCNLAARYGIDMQTALTTDNTIEAPDGSREFVQTDQYVPEQEPTLIEDQGQPEPMPEPAPAADPVPLHVADPGIEPEYEQEGLKWD